MRIPTLRNRGWIGKNKICETIESTLREASIVMNKGVRFCALLFSMYRGAEMKIQPSCLHPVRKLGKLDCREKAQLKIRRIKMEFRPCIDIHNGKVKQIVGGTLLDAKDRATENYVSKQDAAFYARMYQKEQLKGGHVILLNSKNSPYYEDTKRQALLALHTWPQGLMVGGGIDEENAAAYLSEGASHVIVTSYVFQDGKINFDNLAKLEKAVGKEHLVLDLSCRKKGEEYFVVTDRWQKFTNVALTPAVLDSLSSHCSEFLIHAVDVEGQSRGVESPLAEMLGNWKGIPVTYAGGVGSFEHLQELKKLGKNRINVTIGSALDLFGGPMSYQRVIQFCREDLCKQN